MAQVWQVTGGGDKGGIIVREGKALSSAQTADRLSKGALVRELQLDGERLHFEKFRGTGPDSGWVSLSLKGSPLLQRVPGEAAEDGVGAVPAAESAVAATDSERGADAVPATVSASAAIAYEIADAPAGDAPVRAAPPQPLRRPPRQGRTPRIVCLHGTACGERIFKTQLAKLVAVAKGKMELLFVEGPVRITSGPAWETMQKYFPGQTNAAYDEVSLDDKGWRVYRDPRGALAWLQEQLEALAPIDGVLGFSQGANFATMLAAQASTGVGVPLGCCVLLSPNAPGYAAQLPDLFGDELQVPALVVYGEQEGFGAGMEAVFDAAKANGAFTLDTRANSAPAEIAAALFADAELEMHKEGHRPLPGDRQQAQAVVNRVIEFIGEYA